jgi:hypothetical protein
MKARIGKEKFTISLEEGYILFAGLPTTTLHVSTDLFHQNFIV